MRLLKGSSTLYISLSVRVGRIGAKLVCLSITSKQAKVAPECCHAVLGWKWRCPLTLSKVTSFVVSISIIPFVRLWSTTDKIESKPFDLGKLVMKSIAI